MNGDSVNLARGQATRRLPTVALIALCGLVAPTLAQTVYPTRPVRLVVGAPPGGGPDNVARILSLAMNLGQPLTVENRAGAASMIAAEMVAKAPPDGHTLMLVSQTNIAVAPILQKTKSFDPQVDFTGVALVGSAPLVLVAGPALPVQSVQDIIAIARSKPGSLDYGNGGVGTSPYMAGALFSVMTGGKLNSIPYPGEQAAMIDIIAGRVPLMFANASAAMPHIRAGRLRGLAVTSSTRVDIAQGLPTVAESGVPGYEIGTWLGIVAPAGTPPAVVSKLNAEVRRVMAVPEVRDRLIAQGFVLADQSPDQFNRYIKAEYAKWSKLIRDADIKAD